MSEEYNEVMSNMCNVSAYYTEDYDNAMIQLSAANEKLSETEDKLSESEAENKRLAAEIAALRAQLAERSDS